LAPNFSNIKRFEYRAMIVGFIPTYKTNVGTWENKKGGAYFIAQGSVLGLLKPARQ
jgi:hypothetical protein